MSRLILIVDDNLLNRTLLKKLLSDDYEAIEAENGEQALALMTENHQTLSAVLLDIMMPVMDGYEVLEKARENPLLERLPIIMVTANEDEISRVRALSLGANDFVCKPFNPEIIRHCLKNNIALMETERTLNAIEKDKLTGLYNRETFFEKASELIKEQEPGYFVLASFDVDNFKLVNDRFGVKEGDRILQEIGRVVLYDMSVIGGVGGRISADNFAALYPCGSKGGSIVKVIQEDANAFSRRQPITISVGRCIVNDVSLSASAIYDRAYIAKASVKGRYDEHVAYFNDEMLDTLISEQQINAEMSRGISSRQFEVWYQPQYNHATGAMIGAEALVRWRHPDKGLVAPARFIPVFEQNGFIYELDKYVWEETCRFLKGEKDAGRSPVPVSVNISRYDMFRIDFMESLLGIIKKYAVEINLLRLEVTESAFAESSKHIISTVNELINMGFTVEIDDFGSGYSSLNTLKSVPAQIMKLDMRFFEEDGDSRRGGNIVQSVVRMAKWLGMSVIAEGVEKKEQADYLKTIGCEFIQGYLYAKPMDEESFRELCIKTKNRENLLAMQTVENLDNLSFWDAKSMDTLIFNSYVGAACILEYCEGRLELLRATDLFCHTIFGEKTSVSEVMKIRLGDYFEEKSAERFLADINESVKNRKGISGEYLLIDLPGCSKEIYLRSNLRVIATMGDRHLVYCISENITAQRLAEKNEKRLSEQMNSIMDNVDVGIIAATVENGKANYVFANGHYYSLLGYTKEQFESELSSPYDTIAPEDLEYVYRSTRDLKEVGRTIVLDYNALRRDGRKIFLRATVLISRLSGIKSPVQISIIRDVTVEKEVERKEKQAKEQANAIMKDMANGITAVVLDGKNVHVIFANDKFYSMRGHTRETYRAEVQNFYTTIHPDDREYVYNSFMEAYETEKTSTVEYRLIRRDGAERWMQLDFSSTRFTGIDKNVLLCLYTDITFKKKAEQAIKDTSKQLRSMMDDMPGGFVRLKIENDNKLRVVFINDGLCNLTGMTRAEIFARYEKDAFGCVHPDDAKMVSELWKQTMERGEARSERYRLYHKTNGSVCVTSFGRFTRDEYGNSFFSMYFTDETEAVQKETLQKDLLDNLPCGAALYSYDGENIKAIHLNRRYWELVEREPPENSKLSFLGALKEEDLPALNEELKLAISENRDFEKILHIRKGKEGYRPFKVVGRITKDSDGKYFIYSSYTPVNEESKA